MLWGVASWIFRGWVWGKKNNYRLNLNVSLMTSDGHRRYKYMVIIFNVFVFLLGGLLLSLGIFFQLESGFLDEAVVDLFNHIEDNGFKFGTLGRAVVFTMIAVGAFLIIISIVGMVGAWKMIRCCLILFVMILVFLVLCQFVVCGFWLNIRTRSDQWLRGQMLDLLSKYKGPTQSDDISKGFNTMFVNAKCCGVSDQFKDGGTNSDFTDVSSTWSSTTAEKIPSTCCQGVSLSTASSYVTSTCTNTPKNYYTEGCYDRLSGNVKTFSIVIVVACGLVFFLQVGAVIAACMVMDNAKNKIRQAKLSNRPPPYIGIDTVLRNRESRQ